MHSLSPESALSRAVTNDFELVNGFYVQKAFIPDTTASIIHNHFFQNVTDARRDKDGEIDIPYECWEQPDVDETITKIINLIHPAYPEWAPNDITLRDTNRGFAMHQDDSHYKHVSAILYLSGHTRMTLREAGQDSLTHEAELRAGDLLVFRQSTPLANGVSLDTRTWHGANLDSLTPGSSERRSFLYLGHISSRLAYAA